MRFIHRGLADLGNAAVLSRLFFHPIHNLGVDCATFATQFKERVGNGLPVFHKVFGLGCDLVALEGQLLCSAFSKLLCGGMFGRVGARTILHKRNRPFNTLAQNLLCVADRLPDEFVLFVVAKH